MFDRFTDRARKVMALANQEAQRFNHEYIGTEHILLGLAKEGGGVGAQVLKLYGVDLCKLRQEIVKLVKSGSHIVTEGKLPQTPRTKMVIEYAVEEARSLNHNYVGTEHLLLGLLWESDGIAAQMFINVGLNLNDVRKKTIDVLSASAAAAVAEGLAKPKDRTIIVASQSRKGLSVGLVLVLIICTAAISSLITLLLVR